jgi:anti-anti-sigma regulatory factor
MHISITYADLGYGRAAILQPSRALDGTNYANLIAQAWEAHMAGAQALIVDLRDLEHIGTAGLVGLYAVARLAQGAPLLDLEAGWPAIRALAENQPLVRPLALVSPHTAVGQTLARPPFSDFLTIHTDLEAALAALAGRYLSRPPTQHQPADAGTAIT